MKLKHEKYDFLIAGAGLSGLILAWLLKNKYNYSVVVVESQEECGGKYRRLIDESGSEYDLCPSFSGRIENDELAGKLLTEILKKEVSWTKIEGVIEKIFIDYKTIEKSEHPFKFIETLKRFFPQDKGSIDSYFKDIQDAAGYSSVVLLKQILPRTLHKLLDRFFGRSSYFGNLSVIDYFDENFQNETLKNILSSRWVEYFTPPENSDFTVHAVDVMSTVNGAYYPTGGFSKIINSIEKVLISDGVKIYKNTRLDSFSLKNDKVAYATCISGNDNFEIKAKYYVSDTGIYNTYKMASQEKTIFPENFDGSVESARFTNLYFFFKLKNSPVNLRLQKETVRIINSESKGENKSFTESLFLGLPETITVNFPSTKDNDSNNFTATAFTPFIISEYEGLKKTGVTISAEKILNTVINLIDKRLKGFKLMITDSKIINPVDEPEFDWLLRESIIFSHQRDNIRLSSIEKKINNLFITGSNTILPGFTGDILSAMVVIGKIRGATSFFRLYSKLQKTKRRG